MPSGSSSSPLMAASTLVQQQWARVSRCMRCMEGTHATAGGTRAQQQPQAGQPKGPPPHL